MGNCFVFVRAYGLGPPRIVHMCEPSIPHRWMTFNNATTRVPQGDHQALPSSKRRRNEARLQGPLHPATASVADGNSIGAAA